jgi:dTDP-4-amino-4,6-dideoxygalactose transaminase
MREMIGAFNIESLEIPFINHRGVSAHHLFVILLPPSIDRTVFRQKMTSFGIQTSVHYPLLHRFSAMHDLFDVKDGKHGYDVPPYLPVVESIENRLVTLPMGPHLTDEAIQLIVQSIAKAIQA